MVTQTLWMQARWIARLCAVCSAFGLAGCYAEGSGLGGGGRPRPDGGPSINDDAGLITEAGSDAPPPPTPCTPARSVETLPALTTAMSGQVSESSTMFVSDLFNRFKSACGGCHVEASLGQFHVSPVTFSKDMDRTDVLDSIFNSDPEKVMPPGVGAANTRNPNSDGPLRLGALLKAWYEQGRPTDVFIRPQNNKTDAGTGATFLLSKNVGEALTNIGNCVPDKGLVDIVPDDIDAVFVGADKLPPRLEQTDLGTFDSETLAQHGVVAFAPGYPLWSDSARKIRYVRVPKGESIRFDKDTQKFVIPDDTRFYKTFLRKVIEKDGTEHWRKIETRLIVARQQNPLFGSYQWSDDESEAILDDEPLRNYSVFKDRVLTYVADEAKYESITTKAKKDGTAGVALTKALIKAGAIRRYAIPGSDRCVQCHMGSPSRSFVLGFTPLQINRHALGEQGVIEEPGADELTQLKRLIDYGIVTGIQDPKDPTEVFPLDKSEGSRTPRNDYELKAQGYMLGNCAHCHNPNGFPSVQNPVLATTLNFLPGPGENQGIFRFPLDKFSPRITRGLGGAVKMPYITPSLVDYPSQIDFNHAVDHSSPAYTAGPASGMVLAPWRSLLYRAVDTPFPYSVDLALLPHMPMNVPGFDCRVTQIMGDWMVSVPAVRKHPDIDETMVQATARPQGEVFYDTAGTDTEFQPYTEVVEPDPSNPDAKQKADYDAAKKAAEARLKTYHEAGASGLSTTKNDWSRYNYCPDTSDIVNPTVTGADRAHLAPSDLKVYEADGKTYNVPVDYQPLQTGSGVYSEDLVKVPFTATVKWPDEGVPDRPHWVVTDITDNPPPWVPRRDDWQKILVEKQFTANDDPQERAVVEMLNPTQGGEGVRLSQNVHDYVDHEIPFGLWKPNDACAAKLASVPKVSDYQGNARPMWMDVAKADPKAPVYGELPGAAVFNMVCVNCHGPQADSRGRQADTLQLMTGGDARVANFRDGFLGPTTAPGTNRTAVFDITPNQAGAPGAEDWAARYLAWMALGGTEKLIPRAILNVVATTPIFGITRNLQGVDSANMLGPVQTLCGEFFGMSTWTPHAPTEPWWFEPFETVAYGIPSNPWDNLLWKGALFASQGRLMDQNGDAELWAKLCGLNDQMPVAAIRVNGEANATTGTFRPNGTQVNYYSTANYPADTPIGNEHGSVDPSLQVTNLMPWCVVRAGDSNVPPEASSFINGVFTTGDPATRQTLPLCPSDFITGDQLTWYDLRQWSFRGAINAGLAVFVYLDKVSHGYKPIPPYDQCESLP